MNQEIIGGRNSGASVRLT